MKLIDKKSEAITQLSREIEAVDPFDKLDKRSIYHKAPTAVLNALKSIPEDFLKLSDKEIEDTGEIGEVERRLRYSFWYEYNLAIMHDQPIHLNNIFQGVCRRDYFVSIVLPSSYKMAYILSQPLTYKIAVEEMLDLALSEMRELLLSPNYHYNERGKKTINTSLLALKYKVFESLSGRVHGSVAKNIKVEAETKSLSVNVNQSHGVVTDAIDVSGNGEAAILEDAEQKKLRMLDERIKELERAIGDVPGAAKTEAISGE